MKLSDAKRGAVVELFQQGYKFRRIARILSISHRTASRIVQKFQNTGSIQDLPRSGRPPTIGCHLERRIVRTIRSGDAETASDVINILQINASSQTVRRILKKNNLRSYMKKRKPKLTKEQKKTRFDWAVKHLSWTKSDWEKVIFSDEMKVCRIQTSIKRRIWRNKNAGLDDRAIEPTLKFGGGSIMCWGCICSQGIGLLCKIDGGLDANLYREILDDEMVKTADYYFYGDDFIFQQDNDSKHRAHIVSEWFDDNGVQTLEWPSHSPDLNCIEHVWARLKLNLYKLDKPKNLHELWELVQNEWAKIDADFCEKLVHSMPNRVAAVYQARGGNTKY